VTDLPDEMPDEFPPEQELAVNHFEIKTRVRGVDDPPELLLIADVTHEETMHPWRTQLRFSRMQATNLALLLSFVAEKEGL